jgi:4,5-dihydroxyphthalate decarboxylase
MFWTTSAPEGAGYQSPPNVNVRIQDKEVESLLLSGELDAIIAANVPQSYRAGDPRIRRVFNDCRLAVQEYFEKTRIFAITHAVVVKDSLIRDYPWLVDRLVAAFDDADRLSRKRYQYPKRFSFPTAALFLEEEEQRFGKNPWHHGLEPNRAILEKFIEYAEDQGYISFRPSVDELFVASKRMNGLARSELAPAV